MNSIDHLYTEIISNPNSICVFDLDSTLFNVSPRSEKILHEFALDHKEENLLNLKILHTDWGIFETLLRAGYVLDSNEALLQKLKLEWRQKFFSNRYLHYDVPYKGAVRFVQNLEQKNKSLFYLTGRDVHRMSDGTSEVLNKWGFPSRSELIHLKPHKDLNDEYFKLDWLCNLQEVNPKSKIYLFENEPVNINLVGNKLDTVTLVYMNTTHSRIENVNVPHVEILNFELRDI